MQYMISGIGLINCIVMGRDIPAPIGINVMCN